MPYADPEKKKQADREYAEQNREAIRKRKADWYQQNKQRVADNRRAHRRDVARESTLDVLRDIQDNE